MRIQIHDGRVLCPDQGDVDVESCFGCDSFKRLLPRGRGLECRPLGKPTPRDAMLDYLSLAR